MLNYYKCIDESIWTGRIDSLTEYDAFRWHQCVKLLDLNLDNEIFKGKLGFAFIGFCCDEGVRLNKGRIGAAKGPLSIRKALVNLPCRFNQRVKLFDAGNIYYEKDTDLIDCQNALAFAVQKIKNLNLFPIILGGGHETTLGNFMGNLNYLKDNSNNPSLGIINFDAHFDLRPYPNGGTSGTMFRQISDICASTSIDYGYLCLGIQEHSNTLNLFRTADELGAEYVLAKNMTGIDEDYWTILDKIDNFLAFNENIYITICSDVFSSGFAPGVSATQPLGLSPEICLKLLKHILKSKKVISFDISEVAPRFDSDNNTSNLAGAIIFTLIKTLTKLYDLYL